MAPRTSSRWCPKPRCSWRRARFGTSRSWRTERRSRLLGGPHPIRLASLSRSAWRPPTAVACPWRSPRSQPARTSSGRATEARVVGVRMPILQRFARGSTFALKLESGHEVFTLGRAPPPRSHPDFSENRLPRWCVSLTYRDRPARLLQSQLTQSRSPHAPADTLRPLLFRPRRCR